MPTRRIRNATIARCIVHRCHLEVLKAGQARARGAAHCFAEAAYFARFGLVLSKELYGIAVGVCNLMKILNIVIASI